MKKRSNGLLNRWRKARPFFARVGAVGSFAVTVVFALYNGGLGIWNASLWHGSICVYYILLSLLRGILLAVERKAGKATLEIAEHHRRKVFYATSGIVLVMNAALLTPVSLMVLDQRPIQTGLTPAIASAAYTTYKISTAAVKWKRTNGTILDRELSMLRLVDYSCVTEYVDYCCGRRHFPWYVSTGSYFKRRHIPAYFCGICGVVCTEHFTIPKRVLINAICMDRSS